MNHGLHCSLKVQKRDLAAAQPPGTEQPPLGVLLGAAQPLLAPPQEALLVVLQLLQARPQEAPLVVVQRQEVPLLVQGRLQAWQS